MAIHHFKVNAFDLRGPDAFPSCSMTSPVHFMKMKACAACPRGDSSDESEDLLVNWQTECLLLRCFPFSFCLNSLPE